MNFRIDWIDGAPEKLEPGMVIEDVDNGFLLVGSITEDGYADYDSFAEPAVIRWGWLVQPHELEWIADMAQRHGKGRPEQ